MSDGLASIAIVAPWGMYDSRAGAGCTVGTGVAVGGGMGVGLGLGVAVGGGPRVAVGSGAVGSGVGLGSEPQAIASRTTKAAAPAETQ